MRCAGALQTATTTPGATAGPQLTGVSNKRICLREVGIFNTTTTAYVVGIARITATGTQGAAVTEVCLEDDTYTPQGVVTGVNSTAATVGGPVRYATLGAAIGSGVIWTFGDQGFWIPGSASSGIIVYNPTTPAPPSATSMQVYFEWDE